MRIFVPNRNPANRSRLLLQLKVGLVVEMAKKRKKKSMKRSSRRNPATDLTDDLIVDILSRLPSRTVFRSRCVSRRWRDLISHPDYRSRLPQTLSGIFYRTRNLCRSPKEARHFVSVRPAGRESLFIDPSLPFLPQCERFELADCCNGLLLCRWFHSILPYGFCYIVCNPATERWDVVPHSPSFSGGKLRTANLAFDPEASSHFHVFEFVEFHDGYLHGAEIYSSETGEWSYGLRDTSSEISISPDIRSVFLNGMLHVVMDECCIVAIDLTGETWRMICVPDDPGDITIWEAGFIGQSQGRLYYINKSSFGLSIWVLVDYNADEWTLKHRVSKKRLLEKRSGLPGIQYRYCYYYYHMVSIHPDGNLIFYAAGQDNTLMAYDFDRKVVRVICNLGADCWRNYFPYVPLYSDTLVD